MDKKTEKEFDKKFGFLGLYTSEMITEWKLGKEKIMETFPPKDRSKEIKSFISKELAKAHQAGREDVWKIIDEYPRQELLHPDGSKSKMLLQHLLDQAKKVSLEQKEKEG